VTTITHKIGQHFGEGGNQHYAQNLATFWWRLWPPSHTKFDNILVEVVTSVDQLLIFS
jgi:hypothetical protein